MDIGPFGMVVMIVAIVMIARVIMHRQQGRPTSDDEAVRLREEIAQLKQRVQTLERIAVDGRQRLADEIDALGRIDR